MDGVHGSALVSPTIAGSVRAVTSAVAASRPPSAAPRRSGSELGRAGPPRAAVWVAAERFGAAPIAQRTVQDCSRSSRHAQRTAPDGPKPPQESPERTPTRPTSSHSFRKTYNFARLAFGVCAASQAAEEAPKTAPRRPQRPPRGPQDGPRGYQDGPSGPQDGPRRPKRAPRGPQQMPERPQRAVYTTSNQNT